MKSKLIILLLCSGLTSSNKVIANDQNDQYIEKLSDKYTQNCQDVWEPLIEELNEAQARTGDIAISSTTRNKLAETYKKCASITGSLLEKTRVTFQDLAAESKCKKNNEEYIAALPEIEANIIKFESIDIATTEGQIEAYALGGTLQLPLVLLQGRAALNFLSLCKVE